MADYIDRTELLKKYTHFVKGEEFNLDRPVAVVRTRDIYNLPSVDAVEVVRCKDCKYCEERQTANGNQFDYCKKVKSSVLEHFYCIWGEKE